MKLKSSKKPRKDFGEVFFKDLSKNPISDDELNYLTQNINDAIENRHY
ncbi:hypothetical protein M33023_00830 [Candidatus Phytoplasma asteris]|uniref:Uncharacterized protein n=1 Tax=Candidatus Phytoplasma asteris TaxID=85620 RepID=A0ABZ2YGP3_9MOLU